MYMVQAMQYSRMRKYIVHSDTNLLCATWYLYQRFILVTAFSSLKLHAVLFDRTYNYRTTKMQAIYYIQYQIVYLLTMFHCIAYTNIIAIAIIQHGYVCMYVCMYV